MKNLLYKEIKLNTSIQIVIGLLMSTLIFIPSWPSLVSFYYPLSMLFVILPLSLQNQDMLFTGLLPIKKRDIVKGKIMYIMTYEILTILISIPFALLRLFLIQPTMEETKLYTDLGINFALYGIVLIVYAFFNLIYIPWFYKRMDKRLICNIVSFVLTALLLTIFMVIFLVFEPVSNFLNDFSNIYGILTQIGVLLFGIVCFALSILFSIKKGGKNFEKVDL